MNQPIDSEKYFQSALVLSTVIHIVIDNDASTKFLRSKIKLSDTK